MLHSSIRTSSSSTPQEAAVQAIVQRFEDDWRGGERPAIAAYLPGEIDLRRMVLMQLVPVDLEIGWRTGKGRFVEEYWKDFPELGSAGDIPLALVIDEYRARRVAGHHCDSNQFVDRFPSYAAELKSQLIRIDEQLIDEARGQSTIRGGLNSSWPDRRPDAGHRSRQMPNTAVAPTFGDRYQVLGELGRGGMGVVYRVHDRHQDQIVALKTLQWIDPTALYRFKQEFRAFADLSHPHLICLHELFVDGSTWCFTMDLVDGTDFVGYVRGTQGRPDRNRIQNCLAQLLQALEALHGTQKLHRDLKPSNILVEPQGRLVVLDFGLAAEMGPEGQYQSTAGGIVGTVAYMAPEQAAGGSVGAAADWYSIGATLYQALTGRLPYAGSMLQVLREKQDRDPESPQGHAPETPEDLSVLCMGLLRRDARHRYGAAEVRAWLQGQVIADPADGTHLAASTTEIRPVFVGREKHLQELHGAYRRIARGKPVVVRIQGRSGAGKSALVKRFIEQLGEAGGPVVLEGRCYEQESVPYKGLDGLMDALTRYWLGLTPVEAPALVPRDVSCLARLFPVLARVEAVARAPGNAADSPDQHELRRRAFSALRELLARIGDRHPLVLFVDDLQWGDLDSATLMTEILRPPDPPALLVIVGYRSEDAERSVCLGFLQNATDRARGNLDVTDIAVEPLSLDEARLLASALLGSQRSDADVQGDVQRDLQTEAIVRESGGLPFFVHELTRHVQAGMPTALPSGSVTRLALDEYLWARIQQLPDDSRRLLEVVAVSGRPLGHVAACQAAGLHDGGWSAVATLRAARLVRGTSQSAHNEIETYHDRMRETVLNHLVPDVLRAYHLCLAEILERLPGTDPEILAVHFQEAGEARHAEKYFSQAAEMAVASLAFNRAVRLYRLALERQDMDPAETCVRWNKLGDALANAGRGFEAAQAYLNAARGSSMRDSQRLRQLAAMQFMLSGHIDEGLAAFQLALRDVGLRLPSSPFKTLLGLLFWRMRIRLRGLKFRLRSSAEIAADELNRLDVCWKAGLSLMIVDPIRGGYFVTRSLYLALQAGDPSRIAPILSMEGCYETSVGGRGVPRGNRLIAQAEGLLPAGQHPYAAGLVLFTQAARDFLVGSYKTSLELCNQAEEVFRERCTGVAWELDSTLTFSLWSLAYLGEIKSLRQRWVGLLQEARDRGDRYAVTNFNTFIMSVVRLGADEPEEARRDLADVMTNWSHQGYHIQHHDAMLAQVLIDLYQDQPHSAWECASAGLAEARRSLLTLMRHCRVDTLQSHARAAIALAAVSSNPKPLLRQASRDARQLGRIPLLWPQAWSQLLRAGIFTVQGNPEQARPLLVQAATNFDSLGMRLHAEAARRRLGRLLGGIEGGRLIQAADEWMDSQEIRNPARMAGMYSPGFAD